MLTDTTRVRKLKPVVRYRHQISVATNLKLRVYLQVLLGASSIGHAQEPGTLPPSQAPRIRAEVKEVLVPMVVRDERGRHVSGLKASDFEVFEDGKPQRITGFSVAVMDPLPLPASSNAASEGTAQAEPSKGRQASSTDPLRTYLILIDTLHSSFASFGRIRGALGKVFEKERSSDAQYAVIALGREPKIIRDSTRDPAEVLAAVKSSNFATLIRDSEAANLAVEAGQFANLMRQYCSACECVSAGNQGDTPNCPLSKSRVQGFLTSFAERTFQLDRQFLGQLSTIVGAAASMPTSRTIIFISDGFNRFAGNQLFAILMGFGPKDRSFQFNSRDTHSDLEAVLKLATKNNVKFYTLDSRGVYTVASIPGSGFDASSSSSVHTQMDSRQSPNLRAGVPEAAVSAVTSAARANTDALAQLARETGGLFFENSNDLAKGIQQAVADGGEYYILSYVPVNGLKDGTYRSIQVNVRNPKWRVAAKAGYWADVQWPFC